MTTRLETVAFDADDTLWHNERFFQLTQERFAELLAPHCDHPDLGERLMAAEERNLGQYGFGVKGFVLSMIETAVEVTEGEVPGQVISQLLQVGRDMLAHPIELLPHVEETVARLAESHHLVVITKGDLLHQERKLAQSGLGEFFDRVEIVSDKTPGVYARIFASTPGGAPGAMMVGNSMKSDVRPAIEAGAWGVFVPQPLAWSFEHAEAPEAPRFRELADLAPLPDLVAELS
ncbi:HAD family hydrolase [Roseivivax sp. CAU 1761]